MNKHDIKYIIKRVIIAILLGMIYSVLSRFNVHALTVNDLSPIACYDFFGSNGYNTTFSNVHGTYDKRLNSSVLNSSIDYYVFPYVQNNYSQTNSSNDLPGNTTIFPAQLCYSQSENTFSIDLCLDCIYDNGYYICPNQKNYYTSNFRLIYNTINTRSTLYIPQYICGYVLKNDHNTQVIIDNNNQNTQDIIDSQQEIIDSQQQINDSITNPNVNTGGGAGHYFGDDEFKKEYGLSDFVLIPINFIQNLTSTTCSPLVIPIPFTEDDLTLPCMQPILIDKFRDFIILYQTIISGVLVFRCIVGTYHDIEKALDPEQRMEITDMFT